MRKLLFLLALVLLAGFAAGEVQYDIKATEDRLVVNTTVVMDCNATCPGLNWGLVEDTRVIGVRDGRGEIDYERNGDQLSIPGRTSFGTDERVIEIRTVSDRDAEEIHAGLFKRTLQLSGFTGERTSGFISAPDLVSGRVGFGFDSSFEEDRMVFEGTGPENIRIKFGDGYETSYFSFFGSRPSGTELAYEVPVGTTGLVQSFERFPVAVMDDATYDSKVNRWSSGEYVSGAIQIRSQQDIEDEFLPVLGHEVVHGLNDRELNWDDTRSSYFDEGTGKYVEFLMKKKLEGRDRTAEVFGDEVTYTEERNGQRYRYTIPSKGDRDVLWNYYQENRDFMKTWNALDSSPEVRRFGYAYSELVVRNYVREGGSLRQLYSKLEPGTTVSDPGTKWSLYSEHMDMTPCKYDSRERFDQCLESINSYDYPVYSAKPSGDRKQLEVQKLEVPERSDPGKGNVPGSDPGFASFVSGFFDYWIDAIRGLIGSIA